MQSSPQSDSAASAALAGASSRACKRSRGLLLRAAPAGALLAIGLATLALASGSRPLVSASSSRAIGHSILVTAQGRTLYVLTPETSHHLLCKSSACLGAWPPLTVPAHSTKLSEGAGVHGTLGLLKRSAGVLQVTLNGLPLYTFSGDSARGQVNGQKLASFGGTWHVILASGRAS